MALLRLAKPLDTMPPEQRKVTVNLSRRELDALARIAWYEAGEGWLKKQDINPMVNVVVSIINKKVAGMHPNLGANADYRGKDAIQLINQPRRYEPIWNHYGANGDVFKLQLTASQREVAERAVKEAITNLDKHWHPGTLFQQTAITDRRGTSFIYDGGVGVDSVGHQFGETYRNGRPTVVPRYNIGQATLDFFGAVAKAAGQVVKGVGWLAGKAWDGLKAAGEKIIDVLSIPFKPISHVGGDSIGVGTGTHGIQTASSAIIGKSIKGAIPQIGNMKKGDHAAFFLGTNDAINRSLEASVRSDTRSLLRAADAKGVQVTWVLPGNAEGKRAHLDARFGDTAKWIADEVGKYNRENAQNASRIPAQVVHTRGKGIELEPDGMHPTEAGYRQIGALVNQQIKLASQPRPAIAGNAGITHVVGDSLGVPSYKGVTGVTNLAVGGTIISDMNKQMEALQKGATVVAFSGTNNGLLHQDKETIQGQVKSVLEKADSKGIHIAAWALPGDVKEGNPKDDAGVRNAAGWIKEAILAHNDQNKGRKPTLPIEMRDQGFALKDKVHYKDEQYAAINGHINSKVAAANPAAKPAGPVGDQTKPVAVAGAQTKTPWWVNNKGANAPASIQADAPKPQPWYRKPNEEQQAAAKAPAAKANA